MTTTGHSPCMLFTLREGMDSAAMDICCESLKRFNPKAVIYTRNSVRKLPGGEEFFKKSLPCSNLHFSDLFRLWYIREFGGTWIDADTLHLRPMETLGVKSGKLALCFSDASCGPITQHFLHCERPGNSFLSACLERCWKLLKDKGPAGLEYLDFGEWTINHIRGARGGSEIHYLPHWEHHYIPWYRKDDFSVSMSDSDFQFDRGLFNPNAYCYHVTNAVIDRFKLSSREQLLKGSAFFEYLARLSLGKFDNHSKTASILRRLPDPIHPYRFVEVGVYQGRNTAGVGQQRPLAKLVAVDPWKNVATQEYRDTGDYVAFNSDQQHEADYQLYRAHTWFLGDEGQRRLETIRATSTEAARSFQESSLDMVFLDGDHSEKGVSEDIEAWWCKVAGGGWLAGHDYDYPSHNFGVKAAVDKFASRVGLSIEADTDYTWFIKKPEM